MSRSVVPVALVALALVGPACRGRLPSPADADDPVGPGALLPDVACPGGEGCSAVLADAPPIVGAAARDATPRGFELARPSSLRLVDHPACAPEGFTVDGHTVCGELKDTILDD
jgi:hypothetical protein